MLFQRLKNITPSATLIEPEIPDRTQPVLPSREWGIHLAAAQGVFPDKGLQVHIAAWSQMGKGDKVELLLNGDPVDQQVISEDTKVGQRSTLFVAPRHLQTGPYTLSYRVTRLNQTPETQIPPRQALRQTRDPRWPGHESGTWPAFQPVHVHRT